MPPESEPSKSTPEKPREVFVQKKARQPDEEALIEIERHRLRQRL
jgi:hypothetical protein